jgi:urease accessory protein
MDEKVGTTTINATSLQLPRVTGKLHLEFVSDQSQSPGGKTILHVREQLPPLKVVRAFPIADGGALVHIHNVSGGVLGGDQLTLDVEVGSHAYAQITTTSATRLYQCRPEVPASTQSSTVHIAPDGLLEYLPDAIIPFAGSQYIQQTHIDLAMGAGLFWWETIAPGRTAYNELFAYTLLQVNLDIYAAGRPIAIERLKLEPAKLHMFSRVRFGTYRYCGSFYICKVGLDNATWLRLERELSAVAERLSALGVISWGVSSLVAHGLVVRVLSVGGKDIAAGLSTFWHHAKLALYGSEAHPPRKMY